MYNRVFNDCAVFVHKNGTPYVNIFNERPPAATHSVTSLLFGGSMASVRGRKVLVLVKFMLTNLQLVI